MQKSEFMGMLEIYQKNKVIIKIKLNKIECWENHKPFLIFYFFYKYSHSIRSVRRSIPDYLCGEKSAYHWATKIISLKIKKVFTMLYSFKVKLKENTLYS